jgi:hypothetical protein
VIDLSTVETDLLQGFGIVVLGIGIAGGKLALSWLNTKLDTAKIQLCASTKAELEDAAGKAIMFAITQADALIRAKGWDHVEVRNAVLATATSYAIGQFPDALARAGINPSNPVAAAAQLAGILTRKLPEAATTAAASPATPPVTPPTAAPLAASTGPQLAPAPGPASATA